MKGFAELHTFRDPALLEQAMTHPSYANEHPGTPTYQRLEFLGDAVLQLIASEFLLARFPGWDEGALSKARARLVDRTHCAQLAGDLGIHAALRTERGLAGGVAPGSKVLADAFEALVAAIYVDGGLECARDAITPLLTPKADGLDADMLKDAKSELQERCQARRLPLPVYVDRGHTGPDHAREYHVTVMVDGQAHGPGSGRKKQVAEAAAARMALAALDEQPEE
ncbi:MAG: ribonuclease III [Pseudomonadota bacterium]|nr:ribonuclease III [Pseudomonadota bacterium]